jgi:hypothetical protein
MADSTSTSFEEPKDEWFLPPAAYVVMFAAFFGWLIFITVTAPTESCIR